MSEPSRFQYTTRAVSKHRPVERTPRSVQPGPGGPGYRLLTRSARLMVFAVSLVGGLWGCEKAAPKAPSAPPASQQGSPPPAHVAAEPPPSTDPLDQLIAKLQASLAQLQENERNILSAVKQYRVELAKKTADLRSQLARSGQTLDAVRLAPASDSTVAEPRRLDRRCSELRVYLGKIDTARSKVRVLIGQHEDLLVDLPTQKKVNDLIDPQLLDTAAALVSHGDQQNELSPDRILDDPENALLMEQAGKATAAALLSTVLPTRPEKTLEDLSPLPELKFKVTGDAEQFLLDDLQEHLTRGRTTAATHLAENRPEAAIEALQAALDQVQKAIDAFLMTSPLKWHSECAKLLAESRQKLSATLAAPYLGAIDAALKEARQTKNWNAVLDLLEALVRLSPAAPELPEKIATLETVLAYRKQVDDLDAAIAWERLIEIKNAASGKHEPAESLNGTKPGETQEITLPDGTKLKMIWIPPTENPFTMGTPGATNDEAPVQVKIGRAHV